MKTQLLGRFSLSTEINRLRLAFLSDGTPVVAYHDGDAYAGGPIEVQRWQNNAWSDLPILGAVGKVRALAVHQGTIWLAYQTRTLDQHFIHVARLEGDVWEPVGSAIETHDRNNPGETEFNHPGPHQLAFDPLTGVPVLLADDTTANDRRLRAYRLNGAAWEPLGHPLSLNHTRAGQLAFAPDGTLYVAYCEGYANTVDLDFVGNPRSYANGGIADRVTIQQWTGTDWLTKGVGPPNAVYLALAVDPTEQRPWIAYRNRDQGSQLTVRRWTSGTLWEVVGQAAIATAELDLALEFSASGKPMLMNCGGLSGVQIWGYTPGESAGTWALDYEIEAALQTNTVAAAFAPGEDILACAVVLNPYGNPSGGTVARRVPAVTAELSNQGSGGGITLSAAIGAALAPDNGLWWTTDNPETQVWSIGLVGILLSQLRLSLHERDDPTDTPIGTPTLTVLDATPGLETLALAAADLPITASGWLELRARQSMHGREGPFSVLKLHNPMSFGAFTATRDATESSLVHLAWTFPHVADQFALLDGNGDTVGGFAGADRTGEAYLNRWTSEARRLAALDTDGAPLCLSASITLAAAPPTIEAPVVVTAYHGADGNVSIGIELPNDLADMPEPVGGNEA
ncbi:MAG: hypothetical protein RKO66_00830 [Candidatus Contendobacter sp.]|nr:hypothetical protein [Candidatus Contendobacter sp.]MDS4060300.1 hypothetical protein [Candidatus Contendobacter sp.]